MLAMGGNRAEGGNLAFQGDMNAYAKNINPSIGGTDNPFDRRQNNLFNDDFVKQYKDIQVTKNNENLNIINSIFGGNNP